MEEWSRLTPGGYGGRWTFHVCRIRVASGVIKFPEQRPEIFVPRMDLGITRQHRTAIGPRLGRERTHVRGYVSGANWIRENIKADSGKGVRLPFLVPQDVVVGLMLEMMRTQKRREMFTQKFHGVALVRVAAQAQPK